ncbi:MAG: hypothetical protein FIA82_04320 [Melioribacter sp.]|nr:hypothetical protein [Melioribacter sp.]
MFGLWFSIIGLIFGVICSYTAKEKNRAQKEWFILGFIFSALSLLLLLILPDIKDDSYTTIILEKLN